MQNIIRPLNTLFIPGVKLSDLKSLEDMLETQLIYIASEIGGKSEQAELIVYEKIPSTYVTYDTWIRTTNIWCWNCSRRYDDVPIPIPGVVQSDNSITVKGLCCSFPCASRYITDNLNASQKWNVLGLLCLIFNNMYQHQVSIIPPAKLRTDLEFYGGEITSIEYSKYNEDIFNQIFPPDDDE